MMMSPRLMEYGALEMLNYCNDHARVMYRTIPKPPIPPGHLTFLKNFGQIPRYVAFLDGQMPHPLELQRGSNPPLSSENRITYLWKQVLQNFQPLRISCSACLRSTL